MFLAAYSPSLPPTEKLSFTLKEMIFSGGLFQNLLVVSILILGMLMLYLFFEKYLYLKRATVDDSEFLDNIKDCIHDGKIETALDLSTETDAPTARITEKALERLGRPIPDIVVAMQQQAHIEMHTPNIALKSIQFIGVITPLIGCLTTVSSVFIILFKAENTQGLFTTSLLEARFSQALPPLLIGLALGIIAQGLAYVLRTKKEKLRLKIQEYENEFLALINKPL